MTELSTQTYYAAMSGDELTETLLVWSKTINKYTHSNELTDRKISIFMELPGFLVPPEMFYWTKPCPDCNSPLKDESVAVVCSNCDYKLMSG